MNIPKRILLYRDAVIIRYNTDESFQLLLIINSGEIRNLFKYCLFKPVASNSRKQRNC